MRGLVVAAFLATGCAYNTDNVPSIELVSAMHARLQDLSLQQQRTDRQIGALLQRTNLLRDGIQAQTAILQSLPAVQATTAIPPVLGQLPEVLPPMTEAELAQHRAAEAAARESSATPAYGGSYSGGGSVHVRGYTRRDGTYVRPHTRSRPR